MIALQFRFLASRYHATPWGTAVNEGEVEWPPSPWRVLRALVSVWHTKLNHERVPEGHIRALVNALAEQTPSFALPLHDASHTRQYQPTAKSPTLVIDSFVDVRDRCAYMVWPELALGDGELAALHACAGALGYLGRAESWVEARVVDTAPPPTAVPTTAEDPAHTVRRLTPQRKATLDAWRATKRARKKNEMPLPTDVFDALQVGTKALQKEGWTRPPGTEWAYWRLENAPRRAATKSDNPSSSRPMNIATYAIASSVLPHITDAISVCDRLHRTLVSYCATPVFTGKTELGDKLEGHQHAHIIAEPDPRRADRLSRLTVYAPMGFSLAEINALEQANQLWGRNEHKLHLALLDIGQVDPAASASSPLPRLFQASRTWESLMPFVPTRHGKTNKRGEPKLDPVSGLQVGSPAHDLRRLLRLAGIDVDVQIEELPTASVAGKELAWHRWNTKRNGGGSRAARVGKGYRLRFAEPITGPLLLGYAAHSGLGVFVPVDAQE